MKTGTVEERDAYLATVNTLSVPAITALLKTTKDKEDYFLLYYVWQNLTLISECGFQHIMDAAHAANTSAKVALFKHCEEKRDYLRLHRFLKEGMDPRLLNFYANLDGYVGQGDSDAHYVWALFLVEYGARANNETCKKLVEKILELNVVNLERCLDVIFQQYPNIFQQNYTLHRAAYNGKVVIVRWLLQHGVDVNTTHEETEDTALHFASTIFAAKALLRNGAMVDARNKKHMTPLQSAILRHESRMAEFLIDAGADVTVRDSEGVSCMVMAIKNHMNTLLECLIEHGADMDEVLEGELTLIDYAAQAGNDSAVDILTSAKGNHTVSPPTLLLGDSPVFSRAVKSFPQEQTLGVSEFKTSPRGF
jgi:hypothetical protein